MSARFGMLPWLWLSVLVLIVDQATKRIALAMLEPYEPVALLPFLNLTLMFNTGAAFSLLSDASGWQRWFFIVVAAAVAVFIFVWLKRLKPQDAWLAAALSLVLGGAVGNLWDRLAFGHVVDFIDVHAAGWHWPAFNIADSAITVGAVILILDALRGVRPSEASRHGRGS